MECLETYSLLWNLIETVIFLVVCGLFFFDPIRRWNFFGYRPTAVMVMFDPKIRKVLLVRKGPEPWYAFSQGGIYNPDLNFSSKEILRRELGLDENRYSLRYTQNLGRVKINDREYTKRSRIHTISIVRNLRGKGYIACYIRTNLANIEKDIKLGEDITEFKVVSLDEARALITEPDPYKEATEDAVSLVRKQKLLLKSLDEVERIFARSCGKHHKNGTSPDDDKISAGKCL